MRHRRRATLLIVLAVRPDVLIRREMDDGVMKRGVKVHRSVKTRMLANGPNGEDPKYVPATRFLTETGLRELKREEWLAEPKPKYFEWVQ